MAPYYKKVTDYLTSSISNQMRQKHSGKQNVATTAKNSSSSVIKVRRLNSAMASYSKHKRHSSVGASESTTNDVIVGGVLGTKNMTAPVPSVIVSKRGERPKRPHSSVAYQGRKALDKRAFETRERC